MNDTCKTKEDEQNALTVIKYKGSNLFYNPIS